MNPTKYICARTKAEGVLKDKGGRMFSVGFRKVNGSRRIMTAKLAKRSELSRKHPHMLVHDMDQGGVYRKVNLNTIEFVCDKNEEVYFVD